MKPRAWRVRDWTIVAVGAVDGQGVVDEEVAGLGGEGDFVGEVLGGAVVGYALGEAERLGAAVGAQGEKV